MAAVAPVALAAPVAPPAPPPPPPTIALIKGLNGFYFPATATAAPAAPNRRNLLDGFNPYVAAAPGAPAAAKPRQAIVTDILAILAPIVINNRANAPAGDANAVAAANAADAVANAFRRHIAPILKLDMEHQGVQIIRVPYVDELVRRAAFGIYTQNKLKGYSINDIINGAPGVAQILTEYRDAFKSKTAIEDSFDVGGEIRALEVLNPLQIDPNRAKEWDSIVLTLRDKLSVRVSGTYSGFANAITKPKGLDVPLDGLAKTSAGTKTAIIFRRSSPPMGMIRQANPALYSGRLGVVVTRGGNGMVGGKVSASAPLYPSVVMNGGAHPFAVLEGGGDNYMLLEGNRFMPAQQVQDKFDRLLAQLNTLATPSVKNEIAKNGTVGQGIQNKIDSLNTDLKFLREQFYQMDNVKTALSREPLGPGVDPTFTDLAKRGEELNKKVQKVTNSWDKLMTIGEHLEELVSRLKPKPLKGGLHLHDAFKH